MLGRLRPFASLILIACVGCGGSGGGSASVGADQGSISQSRGFAFGDANAEDALTVTFSLIERTVSAGESIGLGAYNLSRRSDGEYRLSCPNNPVLPMTWTHIDNDEDNEISQDDLIKFSHSCTGGSFDAELVVKRVQTQSLVVFEIEGPVEFSEEFSGSDVSGTFDFVHFRENTASWSVKNASVTESHDDGTTDRMSATSVEKVVRGLRHYTIAIDGNLESGGLGGSFSFQTTEEFSGVRGRFPKAGVFELNADTSAVRVMPSSDPALVREHAEYQVDVNGTGQFGTRTTVRWRSFMGGALVNLAPNRPHELTSVRIVPNDPDTTDELNVRYGVSNPDNDDLVTTIEWLRNGSRIDGYDDEYLPSDQTTKDDVITANLSVSDGIVTAKGSASTTIVDAPVTVNVPSPPDSVMYGARLTFHGVASDPDGDPVDELRFVIDHGPAGMTVDPASGIVVWEASGPMFERSMEVNWGLSVDVPDARMASGSIRVEDPSRQYPLLRTDIQVPRGPGRLVVGDFDGDGDQEMMLASRYAVYELEFDGKDYRQTWAHPYLPASAVATGDVDGDGRHEIFVHSWRRIVRLDSAERRVVDSVEVTSRTVERSTPVNCEDMKLADLNDDGSLELVCLAIFSYEYFLVVIAADGFEELWRSKVESDLGVDIIAESFLGIGNVDGDSALEVVTRTPTAMQIYDGVTSEAEWSIDGDFRRWFVVADIDGDGIAEIVASDDSRVVAYSAVTKSSIGEIEKSAATITAGDINGDGRDEIVFYNDGALHVYDYDTNNQSFNRLFQYQQHPLSPTSLTTGDVDNDGDVEIIWGATNGTGPDELTVVGLYPQVQNEWTSRGVQLDGPFVGGQTASDPLEGRVQVFVAATTNDGWGPTRLISVTAEGDVEVSGEMGGDRIYWSQDDTGIHVADYDHDGIEEVFVGLADPGPDTWGITSAYNIFEQHAEWTSSRHHAAVALGSGDVNDDGSDDLVVFGPPSVYVFDILGESLIWDSGDQFHRRSKAMEVVDLDGDATLEILVSDGSALHTLTRMADSEEFVKTSTYSAGRMIAGIVVGDADGDEEIDVFLLAYGELHRLDSKLRLQDKFAVDRDANTILIEKSSYQRKNLVISEDSQIVVLDSRSGAEVWRSPHLIGDVSRSSVQFVEVDGTERVSVGTEYGMYLTR